MDTVMDTIMKLKANAGMLKEQPLIADIARKEMLRLVDVLREQLSPQDEPLVCLCPADGHSELCPIHRVNSSPR